MSLTLHVGGREPVAGRLFVAATAFGQARSVSVPMDRDHLDTWRSELGQDERLEWAQDIAYHHLGADWEVTPDFRYKVLDTAPDRA